MKGTRSFLGGLKPSLPSLTPCADWLVAPETFGSFRSWPKNQFTDYPPGTGGILGQHPVRPFTRTPPGERLI